MINIIPENKRKFMTLKEISERFDGSYVILTEVVFKSGKARVEKSKVKAYTSDAVLTTEEEAELKLLCDKQSFESIFYAHVPKSVGDFEIGGVYIER